MPQSILVCLTGLGSDETALEAGFAAATPDNSHVEALHIRVDAAALLAATGLLHPRSEGATRRMAEEIRQEQKTRSETARRIFTQFQTRHPAGRARAKKQGVSVAFQEVTTVEDELLHRARLHDLVVAARAPELGNGRLEHLVMEAGKPVLIPPAKPAATIGKTVLVAWKDTAESARALTAALPLLVRAGKVTVFSVCENRDEEAARRSVDGIIAQLRRHGVEARPQMAKAEPGRTADKIREAAYAIKADLIVMGAYGHSRLREWMLGGATRELLGVCDTALLMMH